jgi:TonB family protein
MFQVPEPRHRATRIWLVASFLAHCLAVSLWLYRPAIFVQPSAVAWGVNGNSENLVYFPRTAASSKAKARKLEYPRKSKPKAIQAPLASTVESVRAGAPNGSLANGPSSGVEATPALPLVFPDPDIYPWQLKGLKGDVIVEVTIDDKGNVTETRLLQSLAHDIDDKVIATLRNWHFKPALVDGMAISSRQDVHFHFPS